MKYLLKTRARTFLFVITLFTFRIKEWITERRTLNHECHNPQMLSVFYFVFKLIFFYVILHWVGKFGEKKWNQQIKYINVNIYWKNVPIKILFENFTFIFIFISLLFIVISLCCCSERCLQSAYHLLWMKIFSSDVGIAI